MRAPLSLRSGRSHPLAPRRPHGAGRAAAARRRRAATPPARVVRPPGRLAVGLLFALLATACEPFVEGNGNLARRTREVPAFDEVRVESAIGVDVLAGVERSVVVQGDENVLQHVVTEVTPGTHVLVVRSGFAFDSTNPVRAEIGVPTLRGLAAVDRATATAHGVAGVERFVVEALDGAVVTLSGSGGTSLSAHLASGLHGTSRLLARDYPVVTAALVVEGGARAELDVSERVTGTATGTVAVEGGGACEVTPATACVAAVP